MRTNSIVQGISFYAVIYSIDRQKIQYLPHFFLGSITLKLKTCELRLLKGERKPAVKRISKKENIYLCPSAKICVLFN